MLSINIICVGKLKEHFYTDAANEYIKRLGGYCKPEITEIPEQRLPTDPTERQIENALKTESLAIEAKIVSTGNSATIALCVEGRETDSPGLSDLLEGFAIRGTSRINFVIGGSFGLHETIKKAADVKLSLSKLTFPHNLARVILLEQLYRAFKIAEGGRYHK